MTKEDKQIIERGIKENWRIGDRKRLKGLLEKNLKLYRENRELENQIADIKANCDLAIEGRDIKIKELELELTVEKDQLQEEINLHLHAEDYIKSLEKENKDLRDNYDQFKAIAEPEIERLKKENAELKKKIGIYQKGMYEEIEKRDKKLTKATEIIKDLLEYNKENWLYSDIKKQAEQFLEEEA